MIRVIHLYLLLSIGILNANIYNSKKILNSRQHSIPVELDYYNYNVKKTAENFRRNV